MDAPQPGGMCNFFRRAFSAIFSLPDHVVNGPRRATEATTPCLGLKYRKIGKKGFTRSFRPENGKHRTSLPQSTEVYAKEVRCFCPQTRHFPNLFPLFFSFLPRNPMNSADFGTYQPHRIDNTRWQNGKNQAKIRSRTVAMPCQNFFRSTVSLACV